MSNNAANARSKLALRPSEAAEAIGVTGRTLRKWRRHEGLPYFQLDGTVLIPVKQLEASNPGGPSGPRAARRSTRERVEAEMVKALIDAKAISPEGRILQ